MCDEAEEDGREARERPSSKLGPGPDLAGSVAHDLNNLLMVITSHGELLRRGLEPDDPRLLRVQHIMGAAERASRLVEQWLASTRVDSPDHAPAPTGESGSNPEDSSTEI